MSTPTKVVAPSIAELRTKLLGDLEAINNSMANAQQQLNEGQFAKVQTEGALIALKILDGEVVSGIAPTDAASAAVVVAEAPPAEAAQ